MSPTLVRVAADPVACRACGGKGYTEPFQRIPPINATDKEWEASIGPRRPCRPCGGKGWTVGLASEPAAP